VGKITTRKIMKIRNAKTLSGIIVFILALISYLLTLEPTNSYWDCSEFLTCASNLEVGHAPGAPVFMLLGRFFSLFASNPENIAVMINSLSAVSSALTVMLLFYTICWFGEKLYEHKKSKTQNSKPYIVLYSAFIGALTYAFTDSFWFSAVEAEVYATSSLFTALVFWLILKYSSSKIEDQSYKWIVLIFFILGLSVGIHLLNLLTLPAIALVVYFKHFNFTIKGAIYTLLISGLLLITFVFGIIPGIVKMAAISDRFFVNNMELPVYSGALFFVVLMSVLLYLGFQFYKKKGKPLKQVVILSFTFWLIGYSSFAILVIRSAQNPFVDINNVQNMYGLVDYLNREQYPTRPLIYGNNYNSPVIDVHKRFTYKLYNGKYVKDELNPKYIYDPNTLSFFPRMASMDEAHVKAYKQWVNIKGRPVKAKNRNGEPETIYAPTFSENLRFFLRYQLGYMYGRYFMWNFAGKQNDIQGHGDVLNGNWISGIPFIDNWRLGNQEKLPDFYKNHKSRNTYYFLPLFLGIVGLWVQYKHDKNNFWVNVALFFFTGIAIVLYLNEIPVTPRERDYVHVGSFYIFAIWIGIGAYAVIHALSSLFTKVQHLQKWVALLTACLLLVVVPLTMFAENWDDHDRSNRYTANACGKNILKSCEPNAILFTTADNDTYPIWYLQEVEKYRPDVRNVLMTFLPVDWYADQLYNNYDKKGCIPVSFKGKELLMSQNQYFPVINRIDSFMDVEKVIDFVRSSSEKTKVRTADNKLISYIPGNHMELNVNAQYLLKTCPYLTNNVTIPQTLKFTLKKNYLGRDDLLILDIIAKNNWKRPLYFIYPNLLEELGLGEYLYREGMVYRLLPFTREQMESVAKERSLHEYELIMHDFKWGNIDDPDVYLDFTNVQMAASYRIRQLFIETANLLSTANEPEKAVEVLDRAQKLLPPERIPYSWFIPEMVKAYKNAGNEEKAKALTHKIEHEMKQRYVFNQSINGKGPTSLWYQETLYIMQQIDALN